MTITFDEVLEKLKKGKSVVLKFNFNLGIYTRHRLTLRRGIIIDKSYVDNSTTRCSVAAYQKSFYGKAFRNNAVQLFMRNY